MEATIKDYIASQPSGRQAVLTAIHAIIIEEDKTVVPVIEPMMGKEMILYKGKGMMKYGLAGVKKYMSLHVLPMYMTPVLYTKFQKLLPAASFQKGCINFENAGEMPLDMVRQVIRDCSVIDLVKIREDYLKAKKTKSKSKP